MRVPGWIKWMGGVVFILGVFLVRVETSASQSSTLQASFDCSIAAAPIEILICSDEALAALDREMGVLYANAHNAIDGEAERLVQLKEQRVWLKSRLATCQIPASGKLLGDTSVMSACLIEETRKRSVILAEALKKKAPEISAEATADPSAKTSTAQTSAPVNNTTPTETEAAVPAQTASSPAALVLSPPLDPKMASLLAHARESFKACQLKEAMEETELVLAQTHAGAPEAVSQMIEFSEFTKSITDLINEAVELHNNGSYDSSVTKIREAVDKCPAYPLAVETQQKIKISASNYYENQRVEERNRQIEIENQRVAEENARQQEQSSSSSDDEDDEDCDEDGCW